MVIGLDMKGQMMLYNIPIEDLEERYSAQWRALFEQTFSMLKIKNRTIHPTPLFNEINNGEFLDVIGTNYFKASQLRELMLYFNSGEIKDGDILFFHDLWYPGIEMLFYVRSLLKIKFKIWGMLHAGTYDPHDYLTQNGVRDWAKWFEFGWFSEVDKILVATEYHKNLILKYTPGLEAINNIKVIDFPLPLSDENVTKYCTDEKENIVVFPHRLAKEKGWSEFAYIAEKLQKEFPDWKFIKTKDICKNKEEYYKLLAKSKVAVSCASQETWGIARSEERRVGKECRSRWSPYH